MKTLLFLILTFNFELMWIENERRFANGVVRFIMWLAAVGWSAQLIFCAPLLRFFGVCVCVCVCACVCVIKTYKWSTTKNDKTVKKGSTVFERTNLNKRINYGRPLSVGSRDSHSSTKKNRLPNPRIIFQDACKLFLMFLIKMQNLPILVDRRILAVACRRTDRLKTGGRKSKDARGWSNTRWLNSTLTIRRVAEITEIISALVEMRGNAI